MVSSRPFDFFITGVVVGNIAAMACDYFGIEQDVHFYYYYSLLMSAFSYTYYVEASLKLTGLGPVAYFRDSWCLSSSSSSSSSSSTSPTSVTAGA